VTAFSAQKRLAYMRQDAIAKQDAASPLMEDRLKPLHRDFVASIPS
jgi:hypothetical protein